MHWPSVTNRPQWHTTQVWVDVILRDLSPYHSLFEIIYRHSFALTFAIVSDEGTKQIPVAIAFCKERSAKVE